MKEEPWPRLVVFDLDFTLWDCGGTWCDCLRPPFKKSGPRVLDANNGHIRIYPDVEILLEILPQRGCQLGIASRTEQPGWARNLLSLLGLAQKFPYQAIYPSDKKRHFRQLRDESRIDYEDMLFFDDERRNIDSVGSLGVVPFHVDRGVTEANFSRGLQAWRRSKRSPSSS